MTYRSRLGALLACMLPMIAQGHSASDAYLDVTAKSGKAIMQGQWDVALRDLDFVLTLDDNGDGKLTWGEVRRHRDAIERYAYSHLHFDGGVGNSCVVTPTGFKIDDHADGAYAALFFDVGCLRVPERIGMAYDIFFAVDPSHRGIFVMHGSNGIATAVLSPSNSRIDLTP